jgi:hypothetical protein
MEKEQVKKHITIKKKQKQTPKTIKNKKEATTRK